MSSASSSTAAPSAASSGTTRPKIWRLTDLDRVPKNGLRVFSCFHCGGGSTMGYKLAGYDVLGGVDIDPEMMDIYRKNFNPRFSYLMGVQEFVKRPEIPAELFDIDVLDGSPPCSSFSMSGARDRDWGKKKKFREGQADQVLDNLFFDFIDVAKRLRPKVVVAENVKGLLIGKARGYMKQITEAFRAAGYHPQVFLLNSAYMGVPQARERVFFVARRMDLNWEPIMLSFNDTPIAARDAIEGIGGFGEAERKLSDKQRALWFRCPVGASFAKINNGSWFNWFKVHPAKPFNTIAAGSWDKIFHWKVPRRFSTDEIRVAQSFPMDYDFGEARPGYVMGMSVPPLMMARVAAEISARWFSSGPAPKPAPASARGESAPARKPSRARRPKS